MVFLLDTVAFILAAKSPDKLGSRARRIAESQNHVRIVSPISLAEIAIKAAVGKIDFPLREVQRTLEDLVVQMLPFTAEHACRLFDLPLLHNDPFDRQLIAQALAEDIPIVTNDAKFRLYKNLQVVW